MSTNGRSEQSDENHQALAPCADRICSHAYSCLGGPPDMGGVAFAAVHLSSIEKFGWIAGFALPLGVQPQLITVALSSRAREFNPCSSALILF
jgi:hypothetical protein